MDSAFASRWSLVHLFETRALDNNILNAHQMTVFAKEQNSFYHKVTGKAMLFSQSFVAMHARLLC